MSFQKFYTTSFGALFLISFGFVFAAVAQNPVADFIAQAKKDMPVALGNNLYCAGYISKSRANEDYEIVGAENEQDQFIYSQGNNLYISAGANKGVKVGDWFAVIRPRAKFKSEFSRKGILGVYTQEIGAVEVIKVKAKVSVVRVATSCDNFLLGDLLQPIAQRTSPLFAERPALDVFGEPSGKITGRIVMARDLLEMPTREQIVYIDLGAEDNIKVGDYFTIFRPLGKGNLFESDGEEIVDARDNGFQSSEYKAGTFSNNAGRKDGESATGGVVTVGEAKENRPKGLRKIVGELIILNVKERAATAIIVRTAQEIHTGDMVELQ